MPDKQSLPGFSILKVGTAVPSDLVFSVAITFGFAALPKATVLINDGNPAQRTFPESEKEEWQIGESLDIKIGYDQQFELVFSGIIIKKGISSSGDQKSRLTLELRHRYYLSSIKKNSRIFMDKKDSAALEEIFNEYQFKNETEDSEAVQRQMVQFNSSDWDFANLRSEASNMYLIPRNDLLLLKKDLMPADETATLIYGSTVSKFDLEIDSRHCFENFSTITWDESTQETAASEATKFLNSSTGAISAKETGEKSKHGDEVTLGIGSLTEKESAALANRKSTAAELSKIRGTIKCLGTHSTQIGDWIKLEGAGKDFSGKLLVTGVLQEIGAGKWYTTYQIGIKAEEYAHQYDDIMEKPASGLLPGINGLQIGIVAKLESDEADEKILVQLPAIKQGEDAVWARCARMEAGKKRGWVFRPEIGDEVILGFINDDPRQAVILGALHSSKNTAPQPAEDANNKKGYTSREKLEFLFDDEKKTISILTPAATIQLDDDAKKIIIKDGTSSIELSDSGIKMETQKDFKLKATGDIELEGMNVKLKASAQFSAEGSAGIKINSSAVTEIKGSLVKIN